MKTLKCDLCDYEAIASSFEEWMEKLKPHYGEAHAEVMSGKANQSPEAQQAEMQKWMTDNKARFEAQSENS